MNELAMSPKKTPKAALTRDELLAGRTGASESSAPSQEDPRIKSPDDFLLQRAPKKDVLANQPRPSAAVPPALPEPATGMRWISLDPPSHRLPETVDEVDALPAAEPAQPVPPPAPEPPAVNTAKALKEFEEKHRAEIASWIEYNAAVNDWKRQVERVIRSLSDEIAAARTANADVARLKEALRQKEEEIASLRAGEDAARKPWSLFGLLAHGRKAS